MKVLTKYFIMNLKVKKKKKWNTHSYEGKPQSENHTKAHHNQIAENQCEAKEKKKNP